MVSSISGVVWVSEGPSGSLWPPCFGRKAGKGRKVGTASTQAWPQGQFGAFMYINGLSRNKLETLKPTAFLVKAMSKHKQCTTGKSGPGTTDISYSSEVSGFSTQRAAGPE